MKATVHPLHPDHRSTTPRGSTVVRRFRGRTADELVFSCRPALGAASTGSQAESLYDALLDGLSREGVAPEGLVSETLFLRRSREVFDAVAGARGRVLERNAWRACRPATTAIGQPPLDGDVDVELSAVAVVPHRPESWSASDVNLDSPCRCGDCSAGFRAKVVRSADETSVHAGDLRGHGQDGYEEALDMFRVAEALLAKAGMTFRDVVRTWIFLRDIDRDYDALNLARRDFFREAGVERRPASTGVQGASWAGAHDFSMSIYALRSGRPLEIAQMSTPTLNEAWTYGADFSRGLRIVDANKVALHVSGTASLDERGSSMHFGDFDAQAERMLLNISSLLAEQGADFGNLVSAVTYLKHPGDAPALRAVLGRHGFGGFPFAVVEAPLCRPELLCETEAVALLPLPTEAGFQ